jgi:hypothetical protein
VPNLQARQNPQTFLTLNKSMENSEESTIRVGGADPVIQISLTKDGGALCRTKPTIRLSRQDRSQNARPVSNSAAIPPAEFDCAKRMPLAPFL